MICFFLCFGRGRAVRTYHLSLFFELVTLGLWVGIAYVLSLFIIQGQTSRSVITLVVFTGISM